VGITTDKDNYDDVIKKSLLRYQYKSKFLCANVVYSESCTHPDDNDAWLLSELAGIAFDRYTPLADSTNMDGRLSTLVVVLRDCAEVDPVAYACAFSDDWSNIDADDMVVVAAAGQMLLLYIVAFAIDELAVKTRLSSNWTNTISTAVLYITQQCLSATDILSTASTATQISKQVSSRDQPKPFLRQAVITANYLIDIDKNNQYRMNTYNLIRFNKPKQYKVHKTREDTLIKSCSLTKSGTSLQLLSLNRT